MTLLQAILGGWMVISTLFYVVIGIDVILGWLKRPRANKGQEPKQYSVGKTITACTNFPKATIHYPITDEQEAREETIKANDAKGIDTPIEDAI